MGATGNGGLLESSQRSHEAKSMVKEAESGSGGQWAWAGCTAGSPLYYQPHVGRTPLDKSIGKTL